MKSNKTRMLPILVLFLILFGVAIFTSVGAAADVNPFIGTFWSLVPPLVAM